MKREDKGESDWEMEERGEQDDLELFSSASNPLYVFSAATYLFPSHKCELKRHKVIQLCLKSSVMAPSKQWMQFVDNRLDEIYLARTREIVETHLLVYGIIRNYTFWYHHRERLGEPLTESEDEDGDAVEECESEDEGVDMNDHRDHILGWMNELWNKWRGHLHAKYVKDKPIQQSLRIIPRGVDEKRMGMVSK
ncbi:hypothetical protein H5410_045657 [Solanum commersonii]|uniref:Uncharacterized protein n=1 Tax=Solanum commersonii TaxID=4109 RepID=A0A9J5XC95_SOLCO|nr:hypothetical protein H5410_045657 [Solanum commersonii]